MVYFSCCVWSKNKPQDDSKPKVLAGVRATARERYRVYYVYDVSLARSARMVGVYIDGGDERGSGSPSLVVLSPNIARTRPRSNAYFPRSTVECFGENRPSRKAFSTSFSEIICNPFCTRRVASARAVSTSISSVFWILGLFFFSFWIWTLARKAAAHDARTMETFIAKRPKNPHPLFPFFRISTSIPLATDVPRERFLLLLLSSSRRRRSSSAMTVGGVGVSSASSSSQAASAHDDDDADENEISFRILMKRVVF